MEKTLDMQYVGCYLNQRVWRVFVVRRFRKCGAIAQLGERLNGIQEVSGSIPLSSTTLFKRTFGEGLTGFSQQVSLCQP